MGVIKYGAGVDEIKGSVGGATFQKCNVSLAIRKNATHAKAKSPSAVIAQHSFSVIASLWKFLSSAIKADWAAKAVTYTFYNRYAVAFHPTGWQLFTSVNKRMLLAGKPLITTPVNYAVLAPLGVDFDPWSVATSHFNILLSSPIAPDRMVMLYCSKLFNSNRYLTNVKYKYLMTLLNDTLTGRNLYSYFVASFGIVPVVGNAFYWRALFVNSTNGLYCEDNVAQEFINS